MISAPNKSVFSPAYERIAHRTLIVRKLKGLEDVIPFTSVHWEMLEKGTAC